MRVSNPHLHEPNGGETRRRLLDAAGEVFADRGLRAATIREIVDRAGANIAAVNYHFGDKEGLYQAVLEHACQGCPEKFSELEGSEPPEVRLREFIRQSVMHWLAEDRRPWPSRLFAREMMEPTPSLGILVERVMRPLTDRLVRLVEAVGGGRLGPQEAWLCAQSVVAQCAHYKRAEAILRHLGSPIPQGLDAVEPLVEHITRYSLAAIRGYADSAQPRSAGQERVERGALQP